MAGSYRERYGLAGSVVKNLYYRWNSQGIKNGSWETFDDFVKWVSQSDYFLGAHIRRKDPEKPHGPDNSYWHQPRKAGVPQPKPEKPIVYPTENPCSGCPTSDRCEHPCKDRGLWWDVQIGKIRKEMYKNSGESR